MRSDGAVPPGEGEAERHPFGQPGARPVARVAGGGVQAAQDREDAVRARVVGPLQRAARVAEAEPDPGVDVLRAGEPLLGDAARHVHDRREEPLRHGGGGVPHDGDVPSGGREGGETRAARVPVETRMHHHGQAGEEAAERVNAQGALKREAFGGGHGALPERGDQHDGAVGGLVPVSTSISAVDSSAPSSSRTSPWTHTGRGSTAAP